MELAVVDDAGPAERAVSNEEEAILWQTLGKLPESYREPLILYYRQGQSAAEVAKALDLTEDAAKQRLSRGRAMLRGELAALVEHTLVRTRPTAAFTAAVLVALPLASASTATAAVAAGAAAGAATAAGVAGRAVCGLTTCGFALGGGLGSSSGSMP